MAISSFMGLIKILGNKGTGQIGPSQVEVLIDSLHPSPLSGIPSASMEILNVFSECSGLISSGTVSAGRIRGFRGFVSWLCWRPVGLALMERNGVEIFSRVKCTSYDWLTGVGIANSDLGGFK